MNKWDVLAEELVASGTYYAARLNGKSLARQFHSGRAVARFDESSNPWRVTAFVTRWKTRDTAPGMHQYGSVYEEVGTAYVAPSLAGNGLLQEMMSELVSRVDAINVSHTQGPWIRLFLISSNPKIMDCARALEFRCVSKFQMPNVQEWSDRIGLDERLPRTALMDDPHHSCNERWLMIRS